MKVLKPQVHCAFAKFLTREYKCYTVWLASAHGGLDFNNAQHYHFLPVCLRKLHNSIYR